MMIPKSLRVGGKQYTVLQPVSLSGFRRGSVHYASRTIGVARYLRVTTLKFGSAPVKEEGATYDADWAKLRLLTDKERSETFWHELTHAILADMDHPLWRNEKFVKEFSRRLNEAVCSANL